jgi:hypothetical protein
MFIKVDAFFAKTKKKKEESLRTPPLSHYPFHLLFLHTIYIYLAFFFNFIEYVRYKHPYNTNNVKYDRTPPMSLVEFAAILT